MKLQEAISRFGLEAKSKLSNPVAAGAPEDQLRAPLEALVADLAELAGLRSNAVVMVGETSLADIKTRPDYAVTLGNALIGFIEVKAPGKGADPRRFHDRHDKEQWAKLQTLPNLVYTDGNGFSLWRNGELEGEVVRLEGDVETAGSKLTAPTALMSPVRRLLPVGAAAAPVGQGARRHHRPSLPTAARRGDGATGARLALAHQPRDGLAQAPVPERDGRSLRGRLRAGGHLRTPDGAGARHRPRRRPRPGSPRAAPH